MSVCLGVLVCAPVGRCVGIVGGGFLFQFKELANNQQLQPVSGCEVPWSKVLVKEGGFLAKTA